MFTQAKEIKNGMKIELLSSIMEVHGFKSTTAQILAQKKGTDLKFFQVGQGLLIATFLKEEKIVVSLSYYLSDNKSKLERTVFTLPVISFDPASGEMRVVATRKNERQK
jgi:hypothetical protein